MLNHITLMGRMTRNPEMRYTPQNTPVTSFSLAVERDYQPGGTEKQTDFIGVVAWRQTAEFICRYFRKGSMIAVVGELRTRTYNDKNHPDVKHYVTEVYADKVSFCGGKNESSGDNKAAPAQTAPQAPAQTAIDGFGEIIGDSDLPF